MIPDDFETSPRPVSVHAARYGDGETTGWHCHDKGQLLSASQGLMVATTEIAAWFVPAGYALWMPAGLGHEVAMRGPVTMTSAYLLADIPALPRSCRVLRRTPLLGASIEALAGEAVLYDESGRAGHLAALIIDEIARADGSPMTLSMPKDHRLQRICKALLDDPFIPAGIDVWADRIGMSRRSLTRHFRQETGLSFLQWRRHTRQLIMPSQAGQKT